MENLLVWNGRHYLIGAELPLTWESDQKEDFMKYLLCNETVDYTFKGFAEEQLSNLSDEDSEYFKMLLNQKASEIFTNTQNKKGA